MIVTLKRFRPFAWPKLAWKSTVARSARKEPKERGPGFFESFEKMAAHYADTINDAAMRQ